MTKLRDGRYAMYDPYFRGSVRFFGPDGEYLSTLGREGGGPGEFAMPLHQFIDATGDTLFVLDVMQGRLSVFSADGRELYDTRLANVGQPLWGAFLEDGTFIANMSRMTPEGVGLPLHVMTTAGEVIYSFGTDFPVHLSSRNPHVRNVTVDDEGTVWVAPFFEHRLEKWRHTSDPSEPFALDTVFRPGTVEFPPLGDRVAFPDSPDGSPPAPQIRGVWREPDGPVWMIIRIARDDWTERFREPRETSGVEFLSPDISYWQTLIQALDPGTGRVLATQKVDEVWMEFVGDGEAFSYGVTEAGAPYLDVWKVQIHSSPLPQGG